VGASDLLTIPIGPGIGGVVVGFMPWLSRKWNVSRSGWWVWNCVLIISIALGSIALVVSYPAAFQQETRFIGVMVIWAIEGGLASLIVARIARWVCNRWLEHRAHWWIWVGGAVLCLVGLAIYTTIYLITGLVLVGI